MAHNDESRMDELIIRFLQRVATEQDERLLAQWRRASPANEAHYRTVERLWQLTSAAPAMRQSPPPDASMIVQQAARDERRGRGGRAAATLQRLPVLAAAAMVALAVGITLTVKQFGGAGEARPAFGATEYYTAAGERVTVRLADGSIVRLAPSSRLRFTGRPDAREVALEGQAFFAVAKNGLPFIVRTRAGDAHVLGTRFDLRVGAEDLRVVVVDGLVEVKSAGSDIEVAGGQMTVVSPEEPPAVLDVADVYSVIDWLGQSLVFQETPLSRVVREIERVHDVEIRLLGDDLGSRRLTAWFTDESFEDVMSVVCRAVQVHCSVIDRSAMIRPLSQSAPSTVEVHP